MSRIGKQPVQLPDGVNVNCVDNELFVQGKCGKLSIKIPSLLSVNIDSTSKTLVVNRSVENSAARALHGLLRSLISNSVTGVVKPWEVKLEIVGVGYQAAMAGNILTLDVGFANPIKIEIPASVICAVPDSTHVTLSSADKQLVGQIAANIRSVRRPEPYKGKGIRYSGENVKRKSGKAFGS